MSQELTPPVVQALIRRERLAQAARLLRGVVHNISGGMQMLRLPLDLLELRLMHGQTQDLGSKFSAIQSGFSRASQELDLLAGRASQLMQGQPADLDLALLAQEQLGFWRADMFFKHEAELTATLPAGLPKTRAPYRDVALAFNALVANALESLQTTGQRGLRVALQAPQGRPRLLVADDGPGPSPQMAPGLFAPFVGDKGPEHDGLGLFLAQAVLEPWGGSVTWLPGPEGGFALEMPPADSQ